MSRVIIVGAGHGGWDKDRNVYATSPRDGKKWKHKGLGVHPEPDWFLEGVENRIIAEMFCAALLKEGVPFVRSYLPVTDLSLKERTNIVSDTYDRVGGKTLSIDIHTNAAGSPKPEFWSVWTSRGQTQSDKYADYLWERWKEGHGGIKPTLKRQAWTDGDHDYEAGFAMLKRTKGAAILTEVGFMTSRKSVEFITRQDVREFRVKCLMDLARWAQTI